jgi:hypothetical protein
VSRETQKAESWGTWGVGDGRAEAPDCILLFSLKPLPHNAPTQLPQSGAPGAVPMCQAWHRVPVQAPAHSLCRHRPVSTGVQEVGWKEGESKVVGMEEQDPG